MGINKLSVDPSSLINPLLNKCVFEIPKSTYIAKFMANATVNG